MFFELSYEDDFMSIDVDIFVCYIEKMKKIKVVWDCLMENKIEEKGLIMVYMGSGKGKFFSGFGMIMCCIFYGMLIVVV